MNKYHHVSVQLSSVQSLSRVRLLAPHESQHSRPPCPSPTPRVSPKSMSIELVMPSSHIILCHPLLLLPPIPSSIRVFANESTLRTRWPKYWSFSLSMGPSNEHPGLISFRMDWLDLLPCSLRDSQESSPTPKFESINSLALSFLHSSIFKEVLIELL